MSSARRSGYYSEMNHINRTLVRGSAWYQVTSLPFSPNVYILKYVGLNDFVLIGVWNSVSLRQGKSKRLCWVQYLCNEETGAKLHSEEILNLCLTIQYI
jgi:hypothetical protein